MVKHNNVVPNQHFHKQWQRRVKTFFDQPGKKKRRRLARNTRAQAIGPRPTAGLLRPVVRCQTAKFNIRVRAGRGFTFAELKAAGINKREARGIGIAVDHRRVNRSVEAFQTNVERLQNHVAHLVVFPRRKGQPKKGDSSAEDIAAATQFTGALQPIQQDVAPVERMEITEELQDFGAFNKLRAERTAARYIGKKTKKELAAEEALKNPLKVSEHGMNDCFCHIPSIHRSVVCACVRACQPSGLQCMVGFPVVDAVVCFHVACLLASHLQGKKKKK